MRLGILGVPVYVFAAFTFIFGFESFPSYAQSPVGSAASRPMIHEPSQRGQSYEAIGQYPP